MGTNDLITKLVVVFLGNVATNHSLHLLAEHAALGQLPFIMRDIIRISANDAEAIVIIAQCHGNGRFYQRVLFQFLGFFQRYIAGGYIEMKYTRQN